MHASPLKALLICAIALVAVAACDQDEETPTPPPTATSEAQTTPEATSEPTVAPTSVTTPTIDPTPSTPTAGTPVSTPQQGDGTPTVSPSTPTAGLGESVEFQEVSGGNLPCCGPEAATIMVISGRGGSPLELLPGFGTELNKVDFETSYAVVVFRGSFSGGGYEIRVEDVTLQGEALTLEVDLPGPGQPAQDGETLPYTMIAVDKDDVSKATTWQAVASDGTVVAQTSYPPR